MLQNLENLRLKRNEVSHAVANNRLLIGVRWSSRDTEGLGGVDHNGCNDFLWAIEEAQEGLIR